MLAKIGYDMKYWWEKHPGRLDFEIQELEAAGILCKLEPAAFAEGVAVLHLVANLKGHPDLKLKVVYPNLYPALPFEIESTGLALPHHQNPFDKNLCLLDNPGDNWKPSDTVARFISDKLPAVLEAGYADRKSKLESPRSEPFSNYMVFSPQSIIFFDSSWSISPDVESGKLIIGINEPPNESIFRGAVLEVRDKESNMLSTAAKEVSVTFQKKLTGRWVRFEQPPKSRDLSDIFQEALKLDSRLKNPLNNRIGELDNVDVIGILFPEETKWRETGDGWFFIVRTTKKNKRCLPLLVRGGRAGRVDLQGRNPSLKGLESKKVAVFGLGCLGAPSVLEFAKCGIGEIRLLDGDYVEPGTTVRWPFGLQTAAGRDKSSLLSHIIKNDYPFTQVSNSVCRLGKAFWRPDHQEGISEREILNKMLDGVDLIYDATAEIMINHALSELAAAQKIPYILVAGTPGMWGGRIVRVRPVEKSGCWFCYRHATEKGDIPSPISDEINGLIAPEGCRAPTFSGTSFDAAEISMGGVRLAISTLMEGIDGGYPAIDWDVAVINLRDINGAVIAPQWSTCQLMKDAQCHCVR